MFKNSILLMSVFAMSLSLGTSAEATKKKVEVENGPMDKYLQKSGGPKVVVTKPKKVKKARKAKQLPQGFSKENLTYLSAMMGYRVGLTPLQKAWLSKIE